MTLSSSCGHRGPGLGMAKKAGVGLTASPHLRGWRSWEMSPGAASLRCSDPQGALLVPVSTTGFWVSPTWLLCAGRPGRQGWNSSQQRVKILRGLRQVREEKVFSQCPPNPLKSPHRPQKAGKRPLGHSGDAGVGPDQPRQQELPSTRKPSLCHSRVEREGTL